MWRWELTDPALIRVWPKKWLTDPEIAPTIRYLDRYLHDFQRSTETTITTTVNRDAYDSTIGMVFGQPGFDQQADPYSDALVAKGSEEQSQVDPYSDALIGKAFEEKGENSYTDQIVYVKPLTTKTINSEIFTATSNMFIKGKNGATLKLPLNPSEDCAIFIHNLDGTLITIDGNGRKINSHDELKITRKGNGLQIYYFIDDDDYIAI